MSFTTLSQANALNPGAELWIVPAIDDSHWTGQIDWLLNFQIGKAQRHTPASLPETLTHIVQETELKLTAITKSTNALMIAAVNHLPCRWVVVLPVNNNLEAWIEQVYQTWFGMNKASMRVFLPPNLSTATFQVCWKKHSDQDDLTLILD